MPSRTSNKNKLALPTYPPPEGRVCIPVTIPDDPHWIALFTGAIYRLSQQIWYDRDSTHTAQLVAAVWRDIYLATMERAWDCAGGGMFDIRLKPSSHCIIQKSTDGVVWVDAIDMSACWQNGIKRNPATGGLGWEVQDMGFYEFPDGPWTEPAPQVVYPTPKVQKGATDDQKRCNAAYGAAIALQALYQQTWGVFIGWANKAAWTIAQEFADMADDILGALGPLDQFLSIGQDLHEQESSFQDGGFPSSLLTEVQDILFCNSTISGDVVTFNRAGVQAEFAAKGVTPYAGLNFLITLYLGDDGLNAAGNVYAGEGDCADAPCLDCPAVATTDAQYNPRTYRANFSALGADVQTAAAWLPTSTVFTLPANTSMECIFRVQLDVWHHAAIPTYQTSVTINGIKVTASATGGNAYVRHNHEFVSPQRATEITIEHPPVQPDGTWPSGSVPLVNLKIDYAPAL